MCECVADLLVCCLLVCWVFECWLVRLDSVCITWFDCVCGCGVWILCITCYDCFACLFWSVCSVYRCSYFAFAFWFTLCGCLVMLVWVWGWFVVGAILLSIGVCLSICLDYFEFSMMVLFASGLFSFVWLFSGLDWLRLGFCLFVLFGWGWWYKVALWFELSLVAVVVLVYLVVIIVWVKGLFVVVCVSYWVGVYLCLCFRLFIA